MIKCDKHVQYFVHPIFGFGHFWQWSYENSKILRFIYLIYTLPIITSDTNIIYSETTSTVWLEILNIYENQL